MEYEYVTVIFHSITLESSYHVLEYLFNNIDLNTYRNFQNKKKKNFFATKLRKNVVLLSISSRKRIIRMFAQFAQGSITLCTFPLYDSTGMTLYTSVLDFCYFNHSYVYMYCTRRYKLNCRVCVVLGKSTIPSTVLRVLIVLLTSWIIEESPT